MMNKKKSKNIKWHNHKISRKDRNKILRFKNKVLWFTGLSGCGKSTIANNLEIDLNKKKILTYVLDGDNVRHGLNSDLEFSKIDRDENIRRIGEVSKLLYDSGIMVIVSFISPYRKQRNKVRELIGKDFIEIYVKADIETCKKRDPKGLYKKALSGEIKNFTGISDPYEKPLNPEIVVDTDKLSIEDSVKKINDYLKTNN